MTIVEFLTARLDEDERIAGELEASGFNADDGRVLDVPPFSDGTKWPRRWNPVRVLDEVAAKRATLAYLTEMGRVVAGPTELWHANVYEHTLHLLAQPYAKHPDFNPAWKVA